VPDLRGLLHDGLAGTYRLEREVGRGGMATVFLAHDIKHDRSVALKVLHPELAAALGAERFLREIRIAAHLQHPHILTLIDSGEIPRRDGMGPGLLYYVMPYVEGETLRARLTRAGKLSPTDTARILQEVLDALAHAHGMGIVHRDIKPENVMLTGRHALVMDFGVAKAAAAAIAARGRPVLSAHLRPDDASVASLRGKRALAFAGIGDPVRFFRTLRASGIEVVRERAFADHHPFSQSEIETLIAEAKGDALTLVTTEKDLARLRKAEGLPSWAKDIVPFAVTLEFDGAAQLRKFVADRLFQAREKKFRKST